MKAHDYAHNPYEVEKDFWETIYPFLSKNFIEAPGSKSKRADAFLTVLAHTMRALYYQGSKTFSADHIPPQERIKLYNRKNQLDDTVYGIQEFYKGNRLECKDPLTILRHYSVIVMTNEHHLFDELIGVRRYIFNPFQS